jgi:hypothetical protein
VTADDPQQCGRHCLNAAQKVGTFLVLFKEQMWSFRCDELEDRAANHRRNVFCGNHTIIQCIAPEVVFGADAGHVIEPTGKRAHQEEEFAFGDRAMFSVDLEWVFTEQNRRKSIIRKQFRELQTENSEVHFDL